jgi:hypothetical protein
MSRPGPSSNPFVLSLSNDASNPEPGTKSVVPAYFPLILRHSKDEPPGRSSHPFVLSLSKDASIPERAE